MPRSACAVLCSLFLSAAALATDKPAETKQPAHPAAPAHGGRVAGAHLSCSTQGDALGGLEITAAGTAVSMTESTMAGGTVHTKGSCRGDQALALAAGKGASLIFKSKKSNEFGGAVSDAVLLVIGPRGEGNKRESWMARGGTVFMLVCQ